MSGARSRFHDVSEDTQHRSRQLNWSLKILLCLKKQTFKRSAIWNLETTHSFWGTQHFHTKDLFSKICHMIFLQLFFGDVWYIIMFWSSLMPQHLTTKWEFDYGKTYGNETITDFSSLWNCSLKRQRCSECIYCSPGRFIPFKWVRWSVHRLSTHSFEESK